MRPASQPVTLQPQSSSFEATTPHERSSSKVSRRFLELRQGLVVILLRGHPLLEKFVLQLAVVEPKGFEHHGPIVAESLFA